MGNPKLGDQVLVYGDDGTVYVYTVDSMKVVEVTSVEVASPTSDPILTLITCHNWHPDEGLYQDRLVNVDFCPRCDMILYALIRYGERSHNCRRPGTVGGQRAGSSRIALGSQFSKGGLQRYKHSKITSKETIDGAAEVSTSTACRSRALVR
jgi:hypothetical protein